MRFSKKLFKKLFEMYYNLFGSGKLCDYCDFKQTELSFDENYILLLKILVNICLHLKSTYLLNRVSV